MSDFRFMEGGEALNIKAPSAVRETLFDAGQSYTRSVSGRLMDLSAPRRDLRGFEIKWSALKENEARRILALLRGDFELNYTDEVTGESVTNSFRARGRELTKQQNGCCDITINIIQV